MKKLCILMLLSTVIMYPVSPRVQEKIDRCNARKKKRKHIRAEIAEVKRNIRKTNTEFKQAKNIQEDIAELQQLNGKKNTTLIACACDTAPHHMIQKATDELARIEVATTHKKKSIQKFKHHKRKERALLNDKRKQLLRDLREV